MEKNTVRIESHEGYSFSFGRAIVGGFFATLLIEILIYLQGQNPALMLGKMILGSDANLSYIYLAGGAFCLLVGLIYALFYALILAPMRFISDFIQGILLAVIMTAIAVFTFPKLQGMIDTVMGRHTEVQAVGEAQVAKQVQENHKEAGTEGEKESEKGNEVASTKDLVQSKKEDAAKEDHKKELLYNFMNHLIYAFALITIYRQRRL